jgi:hypothetical protein
MANKIKMTKADHFTALSDFLSENPDTVFPTDKGNISAEQMGVFLAHELELLAKKNSADKKPTAQQTQNEVIKTAIAEGMTANRLYTVTEIQKEIAECAELSNQRVSALLRQMKDDGIVVRTEDKRKAYFSIVG